MTPEIEKRIKAVQAGRILAGYKKTKVGIVPKEWDVQSFGEISFKTGRKKKKEEDYPVYSINNQKGFCSQAEQFENDGYANTSKDSYTLVGKDTFAYNPARINIGSIGLLKEPDKVIISSLYVCFGLNKNCNLSFFESYFKSHRFNYDVSNYTEGSVRQYLFYDNFSKINVAIPPLSEQKKIAEILATQDRVIELKEKLIAEKQSQKKYLMSVLLGDDFKKPFKLNGVTIDKKKWRDVSLSDCCLSEGQYGLNAPACAFKDNLPKYIRITDIDEDGRYNRSSVAYVDVDDYENYLLNENDVLLVRTGSTTGKSYLYDKNDGKLVYAGFLIRFNINPEFVDKRVVYACLNTNSYWKWVGVMSMRSGQPGINATEYSKYRFKIPLDKKEQKAIAEVLSAADEEISLLQKDLEQEKLKKKSLMQLLLTGLVRVNE